MNFLKYLDLGLVGFETVTTFMGLIAAKQQLTGPVIVSAVTPLVVSIQSTFNVTIPAPLISDVSQSAADAINRYVFKEK
jgi:hypothetical protein